MKPIITIDIASKDDFLTLNNPTDRTILVREISRVWEWCAPTAQPEMLNPQHKPVHLVLAPGEAARVTSYYKDFANYAVPNAWLYYHVIIGFECDETGQNREMGRLFVERPDRRDFGLHLAFPGGDAAALNFLTDLQ